MPTHTRSDTRSVEAEVGELLVRLLTKARGYFVSALAELDLTWPQGYALHTLQEPMSMRQLADAIGYDASYITGIIDKLEARGLVERRTDPTDRRVKLLMITDAGRALCRQVDERVYEHQPLLERLDAHERRVLRDLLRHAVGDPGPVS